MPSLAPVLAADDLPMAERMAARLDGELYPLSNAHCLIDVLETPPIRLGAALAGLPARFIAELGTAAWVWGAAPVEPVRIEVCVDLRARARTSDAPYLSVRELVLRAEDVRECGGRRVTSPIRTAVDLARTREQFADADAVAVRGLAEIGRFGVEQCRELMDRGRNLPGKRRALARLRSALDTGPPGDYPALTRYTS